MTGATILDETGAALSAAGGSRTVELASDEFFLRCRGHLLERLSTAVVGEQPFRHSFVEQVFPAELYEAIRQHMLACKYGGKSQDRRQDNPQYVNKRFSLVGSDQELVALLRRLFSDSEIKLSVLRHFYVYPSLDLADSLSIHEEFEYVFTQAGRIQNVHVDIPPKLVSFVFYIPDKSLPLEEEINNATILYDKMLTPNYCAKFKANSVCIFAPHFYSYHGFASTMDRDALVMFYVHREEIQLWKAEWRGREEAAPFEDMKDAMERKLRRHPLIEYGVGEDRILAERSACLINAPMGRVLRDEDGRPLPVQA